MVEPVVVGAGNPDAEAVGDQPDQRGDKERQIEWPDEPVGGYLGQNQRIATCWLEMQCWDEGGD